jgi:hypothetical protein
MVSFSKKMAPAAHNQSLSHIMEWPFPLIMGHFLHQLSKTVRRDCCARFPLVSFVLAKRVYGAFQSYTSVPVLRVARSTVLLCTVEKEYQYFNSHSKFC